MTKQNAEELIIIEEEDPQPIIMGETWEEEEMSVARMGTYSKRQADMIARDAATYQRALREYGTLTKFKEQNPDYKTESGLSLTSAHLTHRLLTEKGNSVVPTRNAKGTFNMKEIDDHKYQNVKLYKTNKAPSNATHINETRRKGMTVSNKTKLEKYAKALSNERKIRNKLAGKKTNSLKKTTVTTTPKTTTKKNHY